jgi:CO dehydrogenase maturation factor
VVLISKVEKDGDPRLEEEAKRLHLDVAGYIPYDDNISQRDREGEPTYNLPESSPAVRGMKTILDALL